MVEGAASFFMRQEGSSSPSGTWQKEEGVMACRWKRCVLHHPLQASVMNTTLKWSYLFVSKVGISECEYLIVELNIEFISKDAPEKSNQTWIGSDIWMLFHSSYPRIWFNYDRLVICQLAHLSLLPPLVFFLHQHVNRSQEDHNSSDIVLRTKSLGLLYQTPANTLAVAWQTRTRDCYTSYSGSQNNVRQLRVTR